MWKTSDCLNSTALSFRCSVFVIRELCTESRSQEGKDQRKTSAKLDHAVRVLFCRNIWRSNSDCIHHDSMYCSAAALNRSTTLNDDRGWGISTRVQGSSCTCGSIWKSLKTPPISNDCTVWRDRCESGVHHAYTWRKFHVARIFPLFSS